MLIALSIPYGLGAGAIDAALNNYVALHYTSKHMSWLHCFWGVGTIFSPFVMSYALTTSTWNSGYRIVSLVQLGIGVLLLLTLPVWNANKKQDAGSDDESGESIGVFRALQIKGVPFLLLGFFAYCATESTAMGWASTYLVEVTNISEERAAAFASMFFIGLTFGRFVGGFLMDKLGMTVLFPYAAIFVALAFITMSMTRHGDSKVVAKQGLEAFDNDD
jgi:fucose permease